MGEQLDGHEGLTVRIFHVGTGEQLDGHELIACLCDAYGELLCVEVPESTR